MIAPIRHARLKGARAAERIQRILEVRQRFVTTHERVDVFDALAWLDVRVVFKPLDGLLGAYVRGDQPGVMISTKRPLSVQRFTAAHELGHAVLAHEPSLDSPNVLRRAAHNQKSPKISGFASYLQEIEADAFAGSFLLPNWLISHHAQKHGWTRGDLSNQDIVYQLSLRCGTSYQATVRALTRNGIIDEQSQSHLLNVQPKEIKRSIGHIAGTAETRNDAWVLTEGDNRADIAINMGDTVTIALSQHAGAGYLWLAKGSLPTVMTHLDTMVNVEPDCIGLPAVKRTFYRADGEGVVSLPFEHRRPWEDAAHDDVAFHLSIMKPEQGLSRANRTRWMQGRRSSNVN